jgi:hypothetical protein
MKTLVRTAALVALFHCGLAAATTMLAVDVPTLARGSDAVVRGTVTRIESKWTGDHARIVTEIEVEVAQTIKGIPAEKLTVVQPGGAVGDIGQSVSGTASFKHGEEVVLFLERRPGGTFLVSGMAQGKFRVERSSDGRAAYAVPDSAGEALLLDPQTRQPVSQSKRTMTLDELETMVRASIKQEPTVPPTGVQRVPQTGIKVP